MEILQKIGNLFLDILVPEEKRLAKLLALDYSTLGKLLPRSSVHTEDVHALFNYQNKAVRLLVKAIKYKNNFNVRKLLAEYLSGELIDLASDIALFYGKPPTVLPMPMSNKEERSRGFNQCQEIVREMERICKSNREINFVYDGLVKIKDTPRQATLNRALRLLNVKELGIKTSLQDDVLILVDNIVVYRDK